MIRLSIGLFLILLPFLELVVVIQTARSIGFWSTLLLMVAAALAGGFVLTRQSSSAFRQALEASSRGEIPHGPVLDGLFLMLAGTLLVFPGLITDVMGLLLLVPPVRRWIAGKAFAGIIWRTGPSGDPGGPGEGQPRRRPDPFPPGPGQPQRDGPVIEGEFERIDERAPGPGPRSGK